MSKDKTVGRFTVLTDHVLGRGAFGSVYMGFDPITHLKVAVKVCVVPLDGTKFTGLDEIKTLQHMSKHAHIVELLDYTFRDKTFILVMEYCDRGDLEKYMVRYRPGFYKQVHLMHQCSSAVEYLHSLTPKVVHRDLKPGNILVRTENRHHVVKIADFGVSRILDDTMTAAMMQTVTGTELFMAPEIFAQDKYDEKVDIFSLGLIFLAMYNFRPVDERLLPLVGTVTGSVLKTYGKQLYEASLRQVTAPLVVRAVSRDKPHRKIFKTLVQTMTYTRSHDRPRASDVCRQLQGLSDGSAADVSGSDLSDHSSDEDKSPDDGVSRVTQESDQKQLVTKEFLDRYRKRKNSKFSIGHRILFTDDQKLAEKNQKNHGGWSQHMTRYLGETAYVVENHGSTAIRVKFEDGQKLYLNPELVDKISYHYVNESSRFKKLAFKSSDIVRVRKDLTEEEFKKLHCQELKWRDNVAACKESIGVVSRVDRQGTCLVDFPLETSKMIALRGETLEKLERPNTEIEEDDIVLIIQDRDKAIELLHGDWNDLMEQDLNHYGIAVRRISSNKFRVKVRHETKWTWARGCLRLMAKEEEYLADRRYRKKFAQKSTT